MSNKLFAIAGNLGSALIDLTAGLAVVAKDVSNRAPAILRTGTDIIDAGSFLLYVGQDCAIRSVAGQKGVEAVRKLNKSAHTPEDYDIARDEFHQGMLDLEEDDNDKEE